VDSSVSEGDTASIFKEEFYLKNAGSTRIYGVTTNNTALWMFIVMYMTSVPLKIFAK
jgi:hypothetical protein